jgi:hypothetical protein
LIFQQKQDHSQQTISDLKSQIDLYSQKLQSITLRLTEMEEERNLFAKEKESAFHRLQELERERVREREESEKEKELRNMEKEEREREKEREKEESEVIVRELEGEMAALLEDIEKLESDKAKREEEMEAERERVTALTQENESLKSQLALSSSSSSSSLSSSSRNEEKLLRKKLEIQESELSELRAEASRLRTENQDLILQLHQNRKSVGDSDDVDSRKASVSSNIPERRKSLSSTGMMVSRRGTLSGNSNFGNSELEDSKQLKQIEAHCKKSQKETESLQKDLDRRVRLHEKDEARLKQLNMEKSQLLTEKGIMEKEMRVMEKKITMLERELEKSLSHFLSHSLFLFLFRNISLFIPFCWLVVITDFLHCFSSDRKLPKQK